MREKRAKHTIKHWESSSLCTLLLQTHTCTLLQQDVCNKVRADFLPTYMTAMLFWPLYMMVVFSQVPVAMQLLAVNVGCLVDATFMCWCVGAFAGVLYTPVPWHDHTTIAQGQKPWARSSALLMGGAHSRAGTACGCWACGAQQGRCVQGSTRARPGCGGWRVENLGQKTCKCIVQVHRDDLVMIVYIVDFTTLVKNN